MGRPSPAGIRFEPQPAGTKSGPVQPEESPENSIDCAGGMAHDFGPQSLVCYTMSAKAGNYESARSAHIWAK